MLRAVGLETVNLYTAFVGLALELMGPHGEIVAIIPRSFCNGAYYKPFREWVLRRASIDHIHLFHSRTSAFTDDDVLQENVIIKLVRGKKQDRVTITTSSDTRFSDLSTNTYSFSDVVHPDDHERFIHVPITPAHGDLSNVPLASKALSEIMLEVSTGPVVDFRVKTFLRDQPSTNTVPLLYPVHFSGGALEWPKQSKKPNALVRNAETEKWLYPSGYYTVVRAGFPRRRNRGASWHMSLIRLFSTPPLLAWKIISTCFIRGNGGWTRTRHTACAFFLNSTAVDDYFRRFSGHTQVNATDLRRLKYPERAELEKLGRWAQAHGCCLSQELIDCIGPDGMDGWIGVSKSH